MHRLEMLVPVKSSCLGGEFNVNAETDVNFINLSFFSETTINSDLTANLVNVEGGTLNLNGGVTSISLLIWEGFQFSCRQSKWRFTENR